MSRPKLPAFTVRATQEQAERWQAAAEYDGVRNVGAWLATLATERLRQLGRFVPRMPLRWRRARFRIMDPPTTEGGEWQPRTVAGLVGGPFGIYKGDLGGFRLMHVPTGHPIISLPRMGHCKSLARELATFKVNWNATVPEEVTGPDVDRLAVELMTARRAADPQQVPHWDEAKGGAELAPPAVPPPLIKPGRLFLRACGPPLLEPTWSP